ncbi:MAG TPA: WecB/TagA/CpsF family glycosyltransferase [Mycobacteriales bacterium]|nr:WecB/TagA/CpsF family glycosyltransferase [Mycobacteriales bacterium]
MAISAADASAPPDLMPRPRQRVSGITFDALRRDEAVRVCCTAIERDKPITIGVVNAAKIVNMRSDALLAESVTGADMVLADGQSVVWASRILRRPLPERVAGIDLFVDLLAAAERIGVGVYFLGATDEVLDRMLERVRADYPALSISGAHNGYFDLATEGAGVAEEIKRTGARMLFVGMTSPRKEIFLAEHGDATGTVLRHGVGGSFDVLAGLTKRAPAWVQRVGLEWLYRLLQEPRRLFRRYAVTNTVYIGLVAHELLNPDRVGAPSDTSSSASPTPRVPTTELPDALPMTRTGRAG